MGIYSNNSTMLSNNDGIIANEAYANSLGALQLMVECQQNDLALFEGAIKYDFNEVAIMNNNNYMTESVVAINEAGVKDMLNSAKLLIDKIITKIKAIFDKFIGKLDLLFKKDIDKLVKKYRAAFDTNDYSKMVVKNYMPIKNLKAVDIDTFKDLDDDDTGMKDELTVEYFLGKTINSTISDSKEYDEEVRKLMFGEETSEAGAVYDDQDNIIAVLIGGSKFLKHVKDEKQYCISQLQTLKKNVIQLESKYAKEKDDEMLEKSHRIVTNLNLATSACTKTFNTYTKYLKKAISQSKKVFVMAATYTPKAESVFANTYGEVLAEEVMDFFDED